MTLGNNHRDGVVESAPNRTDNSANLYMTSQNNISREEDGIIGQLPTETVEFPEYEITDVNDISDPMKMGAKRVFTNASYEEQIVLEIS